MCRLISGLDESDERLVAALRRSPRATVTDLARLTGFARGTVHSRLRRLIDDGIVTGFGPDLSPHRVGYGVTAFTTLSITQGSHRTVVDKLAEIREVLEVHVVTGAGDLLCRIAAQSNDHLHELLQDIVGMPEVGRAESQLALSTPVARIHADLFTGGHR